MLAVITSTLFPQDKSMYGGPRSVVSSEERIRQTIQTVESLKAIDLQEILIVDNSGAGWIKGTERYFPGIEIIRQGHFQLNNKGLNECYMLADIINYIPSGKHILKISGRYILLADIRKEIDGYDFAVRLMKEKRVGSYMHTSCYVVRDRELFNGFIEDVIYEHYAHYARVNGIRSFTRMMANSLMPRLRKFYFHDPSRPIEFAAAQALIMKPYKVKTIGYGIVKGEAGANKGVLHTH